MNGAHVNVSPLRDRSPPMYTKPTGVDYSALRSKPTGLDNRQQSALLAFLRVIADAELVAEQLRCRLCEVPDFEPYEVFQVLQGPWHGQRWWLSVQDLQRWLATQPHEPVRVFPAEDLAALFAMHDAPNGELHYDGFLRMILPKGVAHAWLKEVVLARGASPPVVGWRPRPQDGRMPPEVAYRLCLLLESEVDFCRHAKFHRSHLRETGIDKLSVLQFFDSEQGAYAGLSGVVASASVRRLLADNLGAMTHTQCDALLRRLNPSGSTLVPFDDFAQVLAPGGFYTSVSSPNTTTRSLGLEPSLAVPASSEPAAFRYGMSTPPPRSPRPTPRDVAAYSPKPTPRYYTPPRRTSWEREWTPPKHPYGQGGIAASLSPVRRSFSAGRDSKPAQRVPDTHIPALAAPNGSTPSPSWRRPLSVDLLPAGSSLLWQHEREFRRRAAQVVLDTMVWQVELDAQMEEAKGHVPAGTYLEDVLAVLDRFRKGYVTDTDLWQYAQDFGMGVTYSSFCTLVHEVQLRRPREHFSMQGRLNFRELGTLVLPVGTPEHDATLMAADDGDAKSMLNLLRQAQFGREMVVGDQRFPPPDVLKTKMALFRILDVATRCAEDHEAARRRLQTVPDGVGEVLGTISEAFAQVADGRNTFSVGDLRRAFVSQDILVTELQLKLLWHRYSPKGAAEVDFLAFARQLKPRVGY